MSVRKTLAVLAAGLWLAAAARGDVVEVRVGSGSVPYAGVTVVDCRVGTVKFQTPSGNDVIKPIAEIVSVDVRRVPKLIEAEQQAAEGKAAGAVKTYDAALEQANTPWLQRLVRYRRLRALDAAALVDRGVEEWLDLVADAEGAEGLLTLRPAKAAPKGNAANERAIRLLEQKAEELAGGGQEKFLSAVNALLLDLYRAEELTEKAEALAKKVIGGDDTGNGTGPEAPPDGGAAAIQAQLTAAKFLIEQNKAGEALDQLNRARPQAGPGELPLLLLLSGRARLALAEAQADAPKKARLLRESGLDFMYVVAYFGDSPEAPEALYQAGRISAALGNAAAAGKAFEGVASRYDKSPFAARARRELDALSAGGRSP